MEVAPEYFKVLIQSDIVERLSVPQRWMNLLRELFENGHSEATVRAVDSAGRFWEFRCKIRDDGPNRPVFQLQEWSKFVCYFGLRVGDRIVMQQHNEAQFREVNYRIIPQRIGDDGLWANVEPPERAVPILVRLF